MKFTQRETLHLMGEGFSMMGFDIMADGKPTKITRVKHTNGKTEVLYHVGRVCVRQRNL